ncbi:Uncharacterised protein [Lelliottia amnigena]|uniref:type II toxin-antitoxin system toxin DNA ADP-ribosyl transferase DarT n=1 Tax=Lelliottia amnigena TaxID=61646 RepID=UPI000B2F84BE|nr:DarT ssDNA thymidine ADP-ribosyltransferase family protein [Lelliottia amnigena]QXA21575.1 DUF4433 domain-containing protein [Lelliottia amnigena]VDZ89236.1 Uncharacterised protein [Lelliottia amnigena]
MDTRFSGKYVYHFTYFTNLEQIIKHGLLSTNNKEKQNLAHENIANNDIQHRRSEMRVPCGPGGVVHDYVPFYFTKRSPMLLNVIKNKNIDQEGIIYLAVPIEVVEKSSVVFTSFSANTLTPPDFYSDPADLKELNWDIITRQIWVPKPDSLKQQKMAELLIHNRVLISDISYIVVWDAEIKQCVSNLLTNNGLHHLEVRDDWRSFDDHYFHDLNVAGKINIVSGPIILLKETQSTIKFIKENKPSHPSYENLNDALNAINHDFDCIKELSDINGLETDNTVHREDVGTHTRSVVSLLKMEHEYEILSERERQVITLAAYFHDIGKGPKTRWPNQIQKVDDTHPIKSLPMLKRILCNEIGGLSNKEIRQIVTLVVYDDLVGDIIFCGRNEDQMKNIIKIKSDVDMLILIAKCDINSIFPGRVDCHKVQIEELRARMYNHLEETI